MSDAKTEMLARIRATLADATPAPVSPRAYQQRDDRPRAIILDELVERLHDYGAIVRRVSEQALPDAIAAVCGTAGLTTLALPTDVPAAWAPASVTVRRDAPPLTATELDGCDGVLTGCALAIAQTGTIILDGDGQQGRRALSLVPDVHLCVVRADQVVGIVPEGIARLVARATRPLTFISGPSATSDIELSRVAGVHGPRTLHVFVVNVEARG